MRALGWAKQTVGIWKLSVRRTHYKTLGIEQSAEKKEIKKAYLQSAKVHHPDANPDDPKAAEKFQKIQAAYEVLSDASKKADYDNDLRPKAGPASSYYSDGGFGYEEGFSTADEWSQFDRDFGFSGFNFANDRSAGSKRRQNSGAYDPWEQYVKNQQTRSFYHAAMDAEYGDPNASYNNYFNDDDVFDDFYFDEYPNENYQRYSYKNFDQWENQRQKYESIFNQKYGFNKKNSKSKKNFEDLEDEYYRQKQRYWESQAHSGEDFSNRDWRGPYYEEFNNERYGFYDQVQYEEWEEWIKSQPKFKEKPKKAKPKTRKKPKEKSESLKNAQRVHAELDEFGQANIEMDGKRFKIAVQKDGSIVMEDLDNKNPFKDTTKKKKKKRK